MSESIFNNAIYLDDVPKSDWKNYIGNGYRSVCYTTDQNKHGKIIFFGFDKNDEPKTFICPWQSYIKYNVKYETSERDIYDHYVATKYFNSKYERDQYVKNANGINIVECLKPESEFLHFMFDENVLDMNFNKQPLRLHYFDIETEISDKFEKPVDARNKIIMMSIYDSLTKKFYTWSLQKCSLNFETEPIKDYPKDIFVIFDHFHNDELAMLEHFLSWMEDNYADISITYNGKAYDMPYLVRRIENTLGKNHAKRLSPVGRYFIKEVNHDNERADVSAEIEVNISGLFIADCLLLYRDKFQIGGSLDGGFSLDNVGEHEGCGNKIKYEGTLKDLYLNDWQRFYEYNIRDVDLLKRLDDKCKMIQLARQITSFGLADYNQIYGSIAYLIGSVIAFSKTQMKGKIFNSYLAEKKNFDSFEGAYVFPTIPGVYRDGIGCVDFASLYPSNIRAANISPETYVGKLLIQYKDETGNLVPINKTNEDPFDVFDDQIAKAPNIVCFYLKLPNEKYKQITLEQIRNLIETKCIYTTNNTLFLKHEVKWGIIAKWCEHFYNLRKSIKKDEMKAMHLLQSKGSELSKEEYEKNKLIEENSHINQICVKNMINSIYGLFGTKHSKIANPDIAQSITRMGQACNRKAEKYILQVFKEQFGLDESIKTAAIGGDTDSFIKNTFVRIKCHRR